MQATEFIYLVSIIIQHLYRHERTSTLCYDLPGNVAASVLRM